MPPRLPLNTVDEAGQLQIRWDPSSTLVRTATGASLEIADGDSPAQHRPARCPGIWPPACSPMAARNQRVDVTLVLDQPSGNQGAAGHQLFWVKKPARACYGEPPQPNKG